MTLALPILRDRAAMLASARAFFAKRNILEVDSCALTPFAPIDANIDVIPAQITSTQQGFLHTSPEYGMKRLLAAGSGDIFYLGHVFRQGEIGRLHNPEFTMAEWYRVGFSLDPMIEETAAFISLFLGARPIRKLSYRKAFALYADVDLATASDADLLQAAERLSPFLSTEASGWPRMTLLHYLLTHVVEPKLGRGELTALTQYPPEEAALACVTVVDGLQVAERFEMYAEGVELSNGYHELANGEELRCRFHQENQERAAAGKDPYPLDEPFLAALTPQFPDCCGVSVGIDRLLLLRHKATALRDVLPFAWDY
jgi:lysyl-tRNA synthetase class 2